MPSDCNVKKSTHSIQENCKKNSSAKNSRGSLRSDKNNNVNSPRGSATDLDENSSKRREISASSTRTTDSGISELPQDEDIVTELSNPSKLIEVRASERPDTPGKQRVFLYAFLDTIVIAVSLLSYSCVHAYSILKYIVRTWKILRQDKV